MLLRVNKAQFAAAIVIILLTPVTHVLAAVIDRASRSPYSTACTPARQKDTVPGPAAWPAAHAIGRWREGDGMRDGGNRLGCRGRLSLNLGLSYLEI